MILFALSLFVNLFAAGLSSIKDVTFGVFLLGFLILLFLVRKKIFTFVEGYRSILVRLFVGGIVAGFVLGLAMYVVYIYTYNLHFNSYVLTYNNNDFSSTQLVHNHVPKIVFATLLDLVGVSSFVSIDAGTAYIGLLPVFYSGFLGLILLFLLVVIYVYYVSVPKRTLLFTLVYSVISFGLVKNLFDGGLFNYETIPLLLGLLYVLRIHNTFSIKKALVVIGVIEIVTVSIIINASVVVWYPYLKNHILVFVFVGLMIGFHYVYEKIKTPISKIVTVLVFIGLLSGLAYIKSIEYIRYGFNVLEQENIVVTYKNLPDLERIHQIGELNVYRVENSKQEMTVYGLAQHLGLNYKYSPIASLWASCLPTHPRYQKKFILKIEQDGVPTNISSDLVNLSFISYENKRNEYKLIADMNPCLPSYIDVITQYIKEQGFETFWLIQTPNTYLSKNELDN